LSNDIQLFINVSVALIKFTADSIMLIKQLWVENKIRGLGKITVLAGFLFITNLAGSQAKGRQF